MTDWKLRQEWDKTAAIVDVLDRIGNFKVVFKYDLAWSYIVLFFPFLLHSVRYGVK